MLEVLLDTSSVATVSVQQIYFVKFIFKYFYVLYKKIKYQILLLIIVIE